MNRKIFLTLNIICPILAGAFIYYVAAPDVIFVKKIDAVIRNIVNIHVSPADNAFFRLVRNYLPDMLWGYALLFALFGLIGNSAASIPKIFLTAFSFSTAMEILQLTPWVRGTFDVFDIGVEFLAEVIAAFIIKKIYYKGESSK